MMTTGKSIKAGSWFKATFLPQHINANLRDGFVWVPSSWLWYRFLGIPLNCDVTYAMKWCDAIPLHHRRQHWRLPGVLGSALGGQACQPRLTCAAAGDSNPRWQAPHPGEQTQQSCRDWLAKTLPSSTSCKAWNAAWPTQSRNNEVSGSASSWHSYRFSICWCIWKNALLTLPQSTEGTQVLLCHPLYPSPDFMSAHNRWEFSWTTASFFKNRQIMFAAKQS